MITCVLLINMSGSVIYNTKWHTWLSQIRFSTNQDAIDIHVDSMYLWWMFKNLCEMKIVFLMNILDFCGIWWNIHREALTEKTIFLLYMPLKNYHCVYLSMASTFEAKNLQLDLKIQNV